jgi:hypothetical protein
MLGALDKLVVLDLTSHLSGPYAAMMLALPANSGLLIQRYTASLPGMADAKLLERE